MARSRFILFVILLVMVTAPWASADVILDWNSIALDGIRQSGTSPPLASRALAILHAAMFNAVNATDLTYNAYHSYQIGLPGSSAEAAAAQAARDVLGALSIGYKSTLDAALAASLASIPDGDAKANGIALGHAVAQDVMGWRHGDRWYPPTTYTPGTNPGEFPGSQPLLPDWGKVPPFAMDSGDQFRGSGMPDLASAEYAESYNQTKLLGELNSTARSAYDTETALFWADGHGTATPPGHWNMIAQTVAQQQGNSLMQNARLFALLNIALADAAICAWDNKYTYNTWRPITAIRFADPSINPMTLPDPTWTPLLTTPNFPEYTSGHSTFSGAAAGVLAAFYGTDDIVFTTTSDGLPGVERTYTSFSQAAEEAGMSRIYGGIHFEYSNTTAIEMGKAIAKLVVEGNLQPIPEASTFVLAVMSGLCGLAGAGRRWLGRLKDLGH